eukprot:241903-Ditylum_brightwellii.AAC.1
MQRHRTTAGVVLLQDQLLIIANVGNSRAVIARPKQKDGHTNKNDNETNAAATDDDNIIPSHPSIYQ